MISVPAVVGCVVGTVVGNLLARPLLQFVFTGPDAGVFHRSVGIAPWVNVLALLGMPAVCVLAALVPAARAHRLSAARAISAGSAPRAGRALGIQRRLAGSGLPRSMSLGVGLPFARPGRSGLTLAAVVLGVATVTFATGLATTMIRFGNAGRDAYQVSVYAGRASHGKVIEPEHGDRALQSLLRSLPGASEVTARGVAEARIAGSVQSVTLEGRRGDRPQSDTVLVEGRWTRRTGEIVAASAFLHRHGLRIGDHLVLEKGNRREKAVIVGESMDSNGRLVFTDWPTLTALSPREKPVAYLITLRSGADPAAYARAARAVDPGIDPVPKGPNTITQTIVGSATLLTAMLAVVASLGVFNTVVLNTRDRRRDLGTLKSIGMTPCQVTVMVVTSMALLGVVGSLLGVPLGIAGHALVVPRMADAVDIVLPASMTDVWQAGALVLLALSGVAIAVLGAFVPARGTARLTVAEALRTE
jgi:putative ABC transport system permease protein